MNGTAPETSHAGTDTAWTEIYPSVNPASGATIQFFALVAASTLLVFFFGSLNREGVGLALAYLLVFPGALGVGWFFLWALWVGQVTQRQKKRIQTAANAAFREQARKYGAVQYLDDSLDVTTYTGLALAGTSLLAVQDGRFRKFHRAELRGWSWESLGPAQIISNGNGFEALLARGRDTAERVRTNGVYLRTFDPSRPEVHFKTSSEEVCRRWEVILDNVFSGRTVID